MVSGNREVFLRKTLRPWRRGAARFGQGAGTQARARIVAPAQKWQVSGEPLMNRRLSQNREKMCRAGSARPTWSTTAGATLSRKTENGKLFEAGYVERRRARLPGSNRGARFRGRGDRPARRRTSSGDGKKQGERRADDLVSPARPSPRPESLRPAARG